MLVNIIDIACVAFGPERAEFAVILAMYSDYSYQHSMVFNEFPALFHSTNTKRIFYCEANVDSYQIRSKVFCTMLSALLACQMTPRRRAECNCCVLRLIEPVPH